MTKVTFKGTPIRLNGKFPSVGSQAPEFTLVNFELKDCFLKDYNNKKKLLLIVPSLDTPVCSLSTQKFNEKVKAHPEITTLVISADLPFAQKRSCSAESNKDTVFLSMMRDKEFAKAYGVLMEEGPLGGLCARAVIILDEKNTVIYSELVSEITHEPDYDKALNVLFS